MSRREVLQVCTVSLLVVATVILALVHWCVPAVVVGTIAPLVGGARGPWWERSGPFFGG